MCFANMSEKILLCKWYRYLLPYGKEAKNGKEAIIDAQVTYEYSINKYLKGVHYFFLRINYGLPVTPSPALLVTRYAIRYW